MSTNPTWTDSAGNRYASPRIAAIRDHWAAQQAAEQAAQLATARATQPATERAVRSRLARTGLKLSKIRGVDRYRVLDPDANALVHGGEWGDSLDGIAEWLDSL